MQSLYFWGNFSWILHFLSKFGWDFIWKVQKFLLCLTHLSLDLKLDSITRHLWRRRYHISRAGNLRSFLRVSWRKIWTCRSNSIHASRSVLIGRHHVQRSSDWVVKLKICSRVKVRFSFHWSIGGVVWSAR